MTFALHAAMALRMGKETDQVGIKREQQMYLGVQRRGYINGNLSCQEKTRKLMIQIVNTLTVQAEVGGPMACMYLLGHPDHYTSHEFRPFFWKAFVHEANKSWEQPQLEHSGDATMDKVTLQKVNGNIIGLSHL